MKANQKAVFAVLIGPFVAAALAGGWETAKNCNSTCVDTPYAAVCSHEHIPAGNNNNCYYGSRDTAGSYAGSGNNNNNTSRG
jgi:hypothetical protein